MARAVEAATRVRAFVMSRISSTSVWASRAMMPSARSARSEKLDSPAAMAPATITALAMSEVASSAPGRRSVSQMA